MDVEIVKKLIAMKDDRMATLSSEAQALNGQLRELTMKLDEVKQRLAAIESARFEASVEKSMLVQAIGGLGLTMPRPATMDQSAGGEFTVKIRDDHTQAAVSLDLRAVDLTDGEPKVRQHTIEVRRYAVLVTLQTGPHSTSELIAEFDKRGFRVAEENEVANLSAILSRTSFFKSENRKWHLDTAKLLAATRGLPS